MGWHRSWMAVRALEQTKVWIAQRTSTLGKPPPWKFEKTLLNYRARRRLNQGPIQVRGQREEGIWTAEKAGNCLRRKYSARNKTYETKTGSLDREKPANELLKLWAHLRVNWRLRAENGRKVGTNERACELSWINSDCATRYKHEWNVSYLRVSKDHSLQGRLL